MIWRIDHVVISTLLQQHVKSHECSAERQKNQKQPIPDHFFFRLWIRACISLSASHWASLWALVGALHSALLLSLLLVSVSSLRFSLLQVSFGYTIQRLFIIEFSFYLDAKRRSSTWTGGRSCRRNFQDFSASFLPRVKKKTPRINFWSGKKSKADLK